MNQLITSHLAPYLSHGLQMIFQSSGGRIVELEGVRQINVSLATISTSDGTMYLYSCGFKPILRPLSDLTKEINHKGETFVPIIELAKLFHIVSQYTVTSYRDIVDYGEYGIQVKCCVENDESRYSYFSIHGAEMIDHNEYRIVQKLHEWMFDTAGLIESGLAISVHDLEFNPYEK